MTLHTYAIKQLILAKHISNYRTRVHAFEYIPTICASCICLYNNINNITLFYKRRQFKNQIVLI